MRTTVTRMVWTSGFGIALSVAALAQGSVWVVDDTPGPGVDFASIQAAVTAAADGDVILVRDGTYAGFSLGSTSLALIADTAATVTVTGTVSIYPSLTASIALRGFDVAPVVSNPGAPQALNLSGWGGPVWIEDCTFTGHCAIQFTSRVTFVRCTFTGTSVGMPNLPFAVWASNASIQIFDSTLQGATGDDAMLMDGGTLFAAGSSFVGGAGANCSPLCLPFGCFCGPCGSGGSGLHLMGANPLVVEWQCTFVGGTGGLPTAPPCTPGAPGFPIFIETGSVTSLPGSARHLEVSSPVRELQSVLLSYDGSPGDFVLLLFSMTYDPVPVPLCAGYLLPSFPIAVFQGAIPPSGNLAVSIPVPELGPGFEGAIVYTQAVFGTPSDPCNLSSGSALVLLDQAF